MVPLAVLVAAGAALLAVTVATAKSPLEPLPDAEEYLARWSDLHGGHDPRGSVVLRAWLGITVRAARPLAAAGVSPDVLTVWSLWPGAAVLAAVHVGGSWVFLAGWLVALSGLVDALDGAVAALTKRATGWGYVLDSLIDRVNDVLFLLALYLAGGPAALALAAGILGALQEYTRARAGNAGMGEIGVVTVGERGVRVAVCVVALLAVPWLGAAASVGLSVLTLLGVLSLIQLLVAVRGRLRDVAGAPSLTPDRSVPPRSGPTG